MDVIDAITIGDIIGTVDTIGSISTGNTTGIVEAVGGISASGCLATMSISRSI